MAASATSMERLRRQAGVPTLLSLGATLARRGPMSVVSMAISALTMGALCVLALSLAARGTEAPVHDVPLVASSAIAWGGGFLHAFSASVGALRRDRAEGVRHLFVARCTSARAYLIARVGGLAVVLAAEVGGATLLVGVVSTLASTPHGLLLTAKSSAASVIYAVAFAAVISLIAFAALGARTRARGYLFLLAILVLPELLTWMARGAAPSELLELCSVPSALGALRGALAPNGVEPVRFVRALVALLVFGAVGLLVVRRDLVELDRGEPS